jgi:hypothetical protein
MNDEYHSLRSLLPPPPPQPSSTISVCGNSASTCQQKNRPEARNRNKSKKNYERDTKLEMRENGMKAKEVKGQKTHRS